MVHCGIWYGCIVGLGYLLAFRCKETVKDIITVQAAICAHISDPSTLTVARVEC